MRPAVRGVAGIPATSFGVHVVTNTEHNLLNMAISTNL